MTRRRRVLLVIEALQPGGGGPAIAAWTIQALKDAYDVTVLAWAPGDVAALNRFFGTTIAPGDVDVRAAVPAALRRLLEALPAKLKLLEMAILLARARRLARDFDVLFSADAELDFGRPAIQYVNFPGRFLWRGFSRPTAARHHGARLYFALIDWIAPVSVARIRQNVTLVNSDFTAARTLAALGVSGATLYPPVGGDFEGTPWEVRELSFVCISRMSPDKMLHRALDVVAAVRARVPDVKLHVISPSAGGEPAYRRQILSRLEAARDWAVLHEDLSRAELCRLVSRCRYGIHPMAGEPFGMAVGEMVRGGCIVWVPREGGPREIVGGDERLLWDTPAEAAAKILHVLADRDSETDLRARLAERARALTADRFMERIRAVVDAFGRG